MKWNWGTKIAFAYTGFVAFILFMVYLSFGQKFDLVTEDYYAEEIKYQNTIDSKARAEQLNQNIRTSLVKDQLQIQFPHNEVNIKGTINCFRPSDESKDFEVVFNIYSSNYKIPLSRFSKGKYLLKVEWEVNQIKYYQEQSIIIP